MYICMSLGGRTAAIAASAKFLNCFLHLYEWLVDVNREKSFNIHDLT